MQRRSKIALIIGLLVCIYLLMPFFAGIIAKRTAMNFLNNENKTLGNVLGVQLNLTQYNRGWFHSTANLQIEKKAADGNFEIVKTIPVVIKHGPAYRAGNRMRAGLAYISSAKMPINQDAFYQIAFHENFGYGGEHGAFVFFTNKAAPSANSTQHDFQAQSLVLSMYSNSKADKFKFEIAGRGLHFQDPQQSLAFDVDDLNADLQANYLGERHWAMTLGFALGKDKLSATIPDHSATAFTLNANQIDLEGAHFDTQEMAKLLGEVVILKQATDAQKEVKPTAWMALLQQFLTQIIHEDTSASIQGLSVSTPMGQIQGQYDVSFPTLPGAHDYFDVVTRNVGTLQVTVPTWTYTDSAANMAFALKNLMFNEINNTVFSRSSKIELGALNIENTQSTATAPLMAANGLTYTGELRGDEKDLSQIMQWDLDKVCFTHDCFNQIHGKLELLKMNYDAFRGIASATQQVVQYDPKQSETMDQKWMGLANAYVKLISPQTQVVLSHDMNTSEGVVKVHGEISWPGLNPSATVAPTMQDFLNQSVYQLSMLFPAAYVNAFLSSQAALAAAPTLTPTPATSTSTSTSTSPVLPTSVASAKVESPFEMQAAQFLQYAIAQGYLKKVGDAYVLDLSGKGSVITINNVPWQAPQ